MFTIYLLPRNIPEYSITVFELQMKWISVQRLSDIVCCDDYNIAQSLWMKITVYFFYIDFKEVRGYI